MQTRRALATLALSFSLFPGCAKIADIEKRPFHEEDGGADNDNDASEADDTGVTGDAGTPTQEECTDYCGRVTTVCAEDAGVSAFASDKYCEGVCTHFQHAANPKNAVGNTFECKLKELGVAERLAGQIGEITSNCQALGTGGGKKCGTNCDGYCQLYETLCSDAKPDPDCLAHCPKLRDDDTLDSRGAFSSKSDTIQCRLAHLSAAAFDPGTHCAHAAIILTAGPTQPCNPEVPTCEDYCGMLMSTCKSADVLQYENATECLNTCKKGFDVGKAPDLDGDSLACRHYHTYNAVLDEGVHCPHTGPGGDGHCGRICPAYCKLVQKACSTEFDKTFANGNADCLKDCALVTGKDKESEQANLGYSVTAAREGGNNIQCRLYNTSKAFTTPSACTSALGGGDCK